MDPLPVKNDNSLIQGRNKYTLSFRSTRLISDVMDVIFSDKGHYWVG